ncbi:hypothetical protein GC176_19390 [bacterium]|nr:hypothetical protein [bacterium]
MKKLVALSVAAVLAVTSMVSADDVKSGLEPGSSVGAFQVRDITGPSKGKSLCYRCQYGGRPVVSIFARDVNDELVDLIKKVDKQVGENKDKDMKAFVVLLTDEPEAAAAKLEKVASTAKVKNVPLTVFDGEAGPPSYKIAKDADVSVMMWVGSKVKVNEAFAKGKLTKDSVATVVKESKKILE